MHRLHTPAHARTWPALLNHAARQRPSATLGDTGLRLIVARCGDVSVSVRKAAITAISSLFAAEPWHRPIQTLWLAGVVPLAADPEASVQVR